MKTKYDKAIFIDLDETLLNSNKQISKYDINAIKELKKKYLIVINTNRSFFRSKKYYELLEAPHPIINLGGLHIHNPNDTQFVPTIYGVDSSLVTKTIEDLSLDLNCYIIRYFDCDLISNESFFNKYPYINIGNTPSLKEKCSGIILDFKDISSFSIYKQKELSKFFLIKFWKNSYSNVCELISNVSNKKTAMEEVLKKYEISKINTIYIGDNFVDDGLAMTDIIENGGIGIAMKNGDFKLKKKATIITKYDNNNSGVGKTLKKILY